jgi:hypothetical protein
MRRHAQSRHRKGDNSVPQWGVGVIAAFLLLVGGVVLQLNGTIPRWIAGFNFDLPPLTENSKSSLYSSQANDLAQRMKTCGKNLAYHALDFAKAHQLIIQRDEISRDIALAKLGFAYKERSESRDHALDLVNQIKDLPEPPESAKEAHLQLIESAITLRELCVIGRWSVSEMPGLSSIMEAANTYKEFKNSMNRFDLLLPQVK